MGQLGSIRTRRGGREFFLDFRPYGRVWSIRGLPIRDRETAARLLEQIRGKVAEGRPLDEVLAGYLPTTAKANLVPTWIARWLELRRRECEAGSLSPLYYGELKRLAREDGHFSFFARHSIHEITYGVLEDWSLWLADRKQGPKSRRLFLGYFRAFMAWLHKRGEIPKIPEFPSVRVDEYDPPILSADDQDLVLEAVPVKLRGIFLALARLGLRPGEARALDVSDFHDGWLTVDKAMKGKTASAPIRGTKTGKPKRLPVPEDLVAWIERNVDPRARLSASPLFPNPRTGGRWAHKALQEVWTTAMTAVGLPHVPLYTGTKHSFATDAIRRGVPERLLQKFLGHQHPSSTRRYARLADNALLQVLRPNKKRAKGSWRQAGDKSLRDHSEQSRGLGGGPSWARTRD